jgi:hypothetical protein
MKDLDKPHEITLDTDLRTISSIKSFLNNYFEKMLTPEERNMHRHAIEIKTAPYYFAINPDYYNIDKQEEAHLRKLEIDKILEKSISIHNKTVDEMPKNIRLTYDSLLKHNNIECR